MDYKKLFADSIFQVLKDDVKSFQEILNLTSSPPSRDLGDLSFPCFAVSKILKKSPQEISKDLYLKIPSNEVFTFSEVNGYFNAKINDSLLLKETITEVLTKDKEYGSLKIDDKQYVIDTFNANPLKTLHIGHVRNIVTGDFVSRILTFVGADPKPVSYGGDIGTHVAKWYWYYSKLTDSEKQIPDKDVSKWFGSIYIKAGLLLEENKEVYTKEIDSLQVEIMQSSSLQEEIKNLANKSHQAYMDVGKELDVYLDSSFFESDTEKRFFEVKDKLFSENKELFLEDDGAIVADLKDESLGNFILIKQNGAALYGAKDIGLVSLKKERYPSCNDFLYVVASEQDFYFKQLFKLFSFIYPSTTHFHINHGLINTSEGKMKSREGESFLYEDFRDSLFSGVKNKLIENGLDFDDSIVRDISFGVIKFEMLKTNLNKTIVFDISSALDFQGDSSPYVQYSGVRAKSILEKSNSSDLSLDSLIIDYSLEEDEILLALKINDFKEKVFVSYKGYKSHVMVNYVLELSHIFNKFYTNCPVLVVNENTKNTRLLLIKAFLITLNNALNLLGIKVPSKM
ncbi:arginine--tRNA ligase [archaeon]|nr:arginine--tRNA ligase [archaeon]NCP79003.1 arginine--tRNA ligase [archaeon]NCP97614.1 arginine--tRNA ligase [archaeon]NCQ06770.1 arginine--tRNA ligase [archaeon]NCQ50566.1 arginine--tRNA ligase [archaeon]